MLSVSFVVENCSYMFGKLLKARPDSVMDHFLRCYYVYPLCDYHYYYHYCYYYSLVVVAGWGGDSGGGGGGSGGGTEYSIPCFIA
jgi:hypothetical protein